MALDERTDRIEPERVVRELEFRMAVTTAILSTLDLDEILYVILTGLTSGDGLGFNRAILFLDDEGGRELQVRMAVGPTSAEAAGEIWREIESERVDFSALLPRFEAFQQDAACQALTAALRGFSLPLSRLEAVAASRHALILHSSAPLAAVLARCLVNRLPFCSNSLTLIQELGDAGQLLELSNIAIVPLTVGQRLIGAVVADNHYTRTPVDSNKLRSLHAIGNLAALAIDRARLHAMTVAMAEVDGLTGVYNRRYYEKALARALDASRGTRQPLSIAVFDLDLFKQCNDTHGHLVGDEVLKDVARLLSRQVRQGSDIVARYGGEEFVVLLRNTGEDAAVQVAEKLRQAVAAVTLAEGRVRLTISAGVASTLGDDEPAQLFERADDALYLAKQQGRNRVTRWAPSISVERRTLAP